MSSSIPQGSYPIREFARCTGVNPATLRAWERRYGLIHPFRSEQGHRFFSEEHVRHVRRILYWLEQGYPIRQISLLLLGHHEHIEGHGSAGNPDHWQQQQQDVIDSLMALDLKRLDALWCKAFSTYPIALYYQHCLAPLRQQLRAGSKLDDPMLLHTMEHLLQRKLNCLFYQQQRRASSPTLLMATNHPSGELDVLVRACAIGAVGLRVEYLGPNLTPNDLCLAASVLEARQIWIHFIATTTDQQTRWQRYLSHTERSNIITGTPPNHEGGRPNMQRLRTPLPRQIQHYVLNTGRATNA